MNREIVLGHTGLQKLVNDLKRIDMKKILDRAEYKVAERGMENLAETAPLGLKVDGNYGGDIEFVATTTGYAVTYNGEQVAYIEFGTGWMGENEPYPDADILNKANWVYDVNNHGRRGWVYKDHRTDQVLPSIGMVGRMPVYRASQLTEQQMPDIVRKVLSEEFN